MPKVFVSDALHEERLIFGPHPSPGGQGHHGWKALSALYQASLATCQHHVEPVARPEIYQTEWARQTLGVAAGDWHLAVKPIEHLRPFHGIPNAFVCDWPFPELSVSSLGGSPFFDQIHLLNMADAVLCCTDFTADTLRKAGVARVVTLPPYIPPPARQEAAPTGPQERHSFLCVADIHHLSRQLGPTIEGFAQAASQRGGLHLTVYLQGSDEPAVAALRQRVTQIAGALGESVSVVAEGGGELTGHFAAADFFLCASSAPGLCLPLVQAMLAGLPLVTTMNAGTASFLPPDAAVAVATRRETLNGDDEPIGRFMPLTANLPTADAVCNAVLAAAALDQAARSRMAVTGQEIAQRCFGLAAFKAGLVRLSTFVPVQSQQA